MSDEQEQVGPAEDAPVETAGDAAGDAEAQENAATVEAVLFASDSPLTADRIAQVAELPGRRAVRDAVESLNRRYERMGCAFRVAAIAGGYQLQTLPEYHDVVERVLKTRSDSKLTQAAMETLAVIAYRQPVLRADVEAIRGVSCGDILRGLMDRQLIRIVGRAEVLGRPMLYGTTRRFLEVFGLNSLADLPRVEELRSGAPAAAKPAPAAGEDQEGARVRPAAPSAPPADPEPNNQAPT